MAEEKEAAAEIENQEWLDSLRWVLQNESKERVEEILKLLRNCHCLPQYPGVSIFEFHIKFYNL